ncbi:MAG TPA: tetratricopeptide repeat protein [Bradyrhizobium sp.]|uniref:tetratricopeptide repeat protein n=1 Tax=Bradyrhizobium sp. TaxID=376 RepID=UPI002B720D6C|nr:tetratricopeptide repeat protein [Bradyrhizobium sp.]HLZ01209.1 tetratricopeptide repeat protein [Bradyrhizobium sp.]
MARANAGSEASGQPAALFDAAVRDFVAGRLALAEELCRRQLASDPQAADCLHLLGLIQAQKGHLDLAIDLVAQAIRHNQANPDYFSSLGALLARCGRFDESFKSYDLALKRKPDFVEAWIGLGDLLQRQERAEEALRSYEHALMLDPRHAEAAEKSARLKRALQRFGEAASAYAQWAALDPGNYDARNDFGSLLAGLHRFEEAAVEFKAAAAIKPDAPAALNNLGIALTHLGRFAEAVTALDRAIALSPALAELYNTRANALRALDRLDAALADYDRAIALKPDYAEAHGNRGICLDDLARPEDALSSYRNALALKADHADTHWNLAVNRLRTGDFGTGWREAEWRWKSQSLRLRSRAFDKPLWLGAEPLRGKTLLLHNEQGLGDAIQFCRYIPLLAERGAKVVLEIDAALRPLLSGLAGLSQTVAGDEALPHYDFHSPLTSLPLAFDTTLAAIPASVPYLSVPDGARDWSAWLGESAMARIGLVWSGNPNHINDHRRSIALQALTPLFDVDAQFVSLQKNARDGDQAVLRAHHGFLDAGPKLESFADTASLIVELDLVISVDTSVAHLAGSLGKPVWILLPYVADWRWLTGRVDSPWYPTARLFRQDATRAWQPVVIELREALRRFVAGRAGLTDMDRAGSSAPTSAPAAR